MESGETIFRLAISLVLWRLVRSADFTRAVPNGTLQADTIPSQSALVDKLPARIFDAVGRIHLWLSAQAQLSGINGSVAVVPIGLAVSWVRGPGGEHAGLSRLRFRGRSAWRVTRKESR